MKNSYKKIGDGITSVPKSLYGCCNWGNLPGDYLVSTDMSKLIWERLHIDEGSCNYIYESVCIMVRHEFYDRQTSV